MKYNRKDSGFAAALTSRFEIWTFQLVMSITQLTSSTAHACTKNISCFFGIKVIPPNGIIGVLIIKGIAQSSV